MLRQGKSKCICVLVGSIDIRSLRGKPTKVRALGAALHPRRRTFFYLCSLLDGWNRFIVHREICETMTEADIETMTQRAREQYPDARPRIISDNGPQFIARDFKIQPALRDDSCENVAILSAKQREDRGLEPLAEIRVNSPRDTDVPGGRSAAGRDLRAT